MIIGKVKVRENKFLHSNQWNEWAFREIDGRGQFL